MFFNINFLSKIKRWIKIPKSSCLKIKLTYLCSSVDYRVASLFKGYLTTKRIIPESLKSIGQF